MKKLFYRLTVVAALFAAVSCSKDDEASTPAGGDFVASAGGVYVLNQGNSGSNDASLDYFNPTTGATTSNVFIYQNGYRLGDTAQDILIHEDRMYITMNGSNCIYVTDLNAKVIKTITNFGGWSSPRYLAAKGDYIYVTCWVASDYSRTTGALVQINIDDYSVTAVATDDAAPEDIAIIGDNLYVAHTGYLGWGSTSYSDYSNKISVISTSMVKGSAIEVTDAANLNFLEAYDNTLYVLSWENYYYGESDDSYIPANAIYSQLNKIETANGNAITKISDYSTPYQMTMDASGNLYVADVVTAHDYTNIATVYKYSSSASTTFIYGSIADFYKMSYDDDNERLYVMTSDYRTTGEVEIFDNDGSNASYNPYSAYPIISAGLNPGATAVVPAE